MQQLAGLITESQLNEDYLELKSLGKQLYSALKKKGYEVEIKENSKKSTFAGGDSLVGTKDSKYLNSKGGTVEIHQFSDAEQIGVFIPAYAVLYQFIVDPANKSYLEQLYTKKRGKPGGELDEPAKYFSNLKDILFGEDGKVASSSNVMKDPEIKKSIAKLGQELLSIIKSKKPNMLLSFRDTDTSYAMNFAEPKTAKGGAVNPNQRPNAPKPAPAAPAAAPAAPAPQAESIEQAVNEALRRYRRSK
jgi:hypothetical protein